MAWVKLKQGPQGWIGSTRGSVWSPYYVLDTLYSLASEPTQQPNYNGMIALRVQVEEADSGKKNE